MPEFASIVEIIGNDGEGIASGNADEQDVPVPPQDIVGGEPIEQVEEEAEVPQRAASAPGEGIRQKTTRGTRAGRQRQQRWDTRWWRTSCEAIQNFFRPYLGEVHVNYTSWYDAPPTARQLIWEFGPDAAHTNPQQHFWPLAHRLPSAFNLCKHAGISPSTHHIVNGVLRTKAAEARQPPAPPPPKRATQEAAQAPQPESQPQRIVTIGQQLPPQAKRQPVGGGSQAVPKQQATQGAAKAPQKSDTPPADNPSGAAASAPQGEGEGSKLREIEPSSAYEFTADDPEDVRFDRIVRAARNLYTLGFEGAEGLVATCCSWLLDVRWVNSYLDGQRPSPENGPLLTSSERLLLDNVVIEYLRVQYRILAEEAFKATPDERKGEGRGRQQRPGLRAEATQRSRSAALEGGRSRTSLR